MRSGFGMLLLAGLTACTEYHPVAFDGRGSWAQARAAAATKSVAAAAPGRSSTETTAVSGQQGRHLVLPGESLSELAARYDVPLGTLARVNAIRPPFAVHAGQMLAIPAASPARSIPRVVPLPTAPSRAPIVATPVPAAVIMVAELPDEAEVEGAPAGVTQAELEAARHAALKTPPALSGEGFLWPLKGRIVSPFGGKPSGARNNGVNILAEAGTPVHAAENGVVVYAGDEIPGYGNMLLISHANGMVTAYAHNRDLLVSVGAAVGRGQIVARVGNSGGVGLPQLHFEVRDGRRPIDPVAYFDTDETRLASTR